MTGKAAVIYVLAALIATVHVSAQQPDNRLTALRASSKVRLLEAPGPVPILYVPSAEQEALHLQEWMGAAYAWYEKQLHLQNVPVTVEVLDKDLWTRFGATQVYPMPNSIASQGLVFMPDVGTGTAPPFHELGHIFAYRLKIRSGNSFMNELIAGIFFVAYIRSERPDLELGPISAPFPAGTSPRYTSLADLDYAYTGVGDKNYYWFQHQLEHLADFLVKDQSFPVVVERLRAAFPADHQKHEAVEEIFAHLEGVRPGFRKMAGPLAGPSTITRIKPSVCQDTAVNGGPSSALTVIVIQNDTAGPLAVTRPAGNTYTVPPHAFSAASQIPVGASMKLSDGTCLVSRDEPTLAVIEKQ